MYVICQSAHVSINPIDDRRSAPGLSENEKEESNIQTRIQNPKQEKKRGG